MKKTMNLQMGAFWFMTGPQTHHLQPGDLFNDMVIASSGDVDFTANFDVGGLLEIRQSPLIINDYLITSL
jgi:hypothetical protein